MTRQRLRSGLALAVAVAAVVVSASAVAGSASAHESDCHAQQTCPADDHSYVWTNGETQWDCALSDGRAYGDEEPTIIVYEGVRYACVAVPTGTTEPEGPSPPVPLPPEETTPTTTTTARPRAKPKPKAKTEEPRKTEETPYIPPFRTVRRTELPPGRYVFPVDGPVSYSDTFGAARATTGWHHGEDIFGPLGAPVLAVADGVLLKVGWNAVGGNRVWLRDRWGNYFYYAHLSGFAPGAVSGASVVRGEVIGYLGNTGDAVGTPYHLHFEIHPASLVELGYDGVVNPNPYLRAWQRAFELGRLPTVGRSTPMTPGAILLTAEDISRANGLEPDTVVRTISSPVTIENDGELLAPLPPATVEELPSTGLASTLASVLDGAASSYGTVPGATVWDTLAQCESGGDWHANTGIFDGGVQFHPNTWIRYGGAAFAPYAYLATREQQITIARRVLAVEGWDAWPACSLKLGLR